MLNKQQMQEIQNLKILGYTKTDIQEHYRKLGGKIPSRPTISKYYDMDVVPDNPGEKLSKDKAFDAEPFKETILSILRSNERKDFCASSFAGLVAQYGKEYSIRTYASPSKNSINFPMII